MDNAPASRSARATPKHRLSPRSVAIQHAVAKQSNVALRHQADVCDGGYADSGGASDGRDDLGPVFKFELDDRCLHVGVPDHADGVFRWGIATWYEPKGISATSSKCTASCATARIWCGISSRVVEGNPRQSCVRELPTRAMSTSWVSSTRAVGKSHSVHISNPRAGSTPGNLQMLDCHFLPRGMRTVIYEITGSRGARAKELE